MFFLKKSSLYEQKSCKSYYIFLNKEKVVDTTPKQPSPQKN